MYLVISIISLIVGILLMFLPYFSIDIYLKISGVYIIITSIVYLKEIANIGKDRE